MGFGGINIWSLILILVIVLLLFGTKRLRSFGGDLGSAIKGFKKAVKDEGQEDPKVEDLSQSDDTANSEKSETKS